MRALHHRFTLRALLLAALLPASALARSDDLGPDVDGGAVDLAADVPDLSQGIQPSTTPSQFACRVGGEGPGAAAATSLLVPVGMATLLVRRRRRP